MSKKTDDHTIERNGKTAAPWQEVLLVCSKCMKRQDRELRDDIRQALRQRGERDLRVVACGCLDVCPDDGITIALGTDLAATPAALRVVARKQPTEPLVDALLAAVRGAKPSRR